MIRHDNHAFCDEEELERFYKSRRQSPVLGGERFIERVRRRIGRREKGSGVIFAIRCC
jgi:hypothetical protein